MEQKKIKILLVISIVLMIVCGIGVSAIQTGMGKVKMKELNIETDKGYSMSAYLFIPENATEENPAPGIVVSHGYLNNKEMTDANYVELSRRGYVVLAIDQPNHGDSEVSKDFQVLKPNGVYRGVLELSKLPFVDKERIGITGHSMGSWSCNAAVLEDNLASEQLISAVLIHCNDAVYTDENGEFTNVYGSRPVGIISAVYDEFFGKSTDENGNTLSSPYYMESAGAQSFLNFGKEPNANEPKEAFKYYTDVIDGEETFRVTYRPEIVHAWSHFSARSESYVIDFFERAFGAPNPIDSGNQIWQYKEALNLFGLIGFGLFICSFGGSLLYTKAFEELRAEEKVEPVRVKNKNGYVWFWITLILGAVFGTLTYLPVMAKGSSLATPQVMSMGQGMWSTLCGLFAIVVMVVYYNTYGKRNGITLDGVGIKISIRKLLLSILLALAVIFVSYGCVFIADYFFFADFRIWVVALKAFEKPILACWPYLLLFITYYIAVSVSTNCFNFNNIGGKFNIIICSIFATLPAIIIVTVQYVTYYLTNHMQWAQTALSSANYPMYIIGMYPLIVILFVTPIISRFFL
ncbi:MAG: alpha/beta hydrolase [Tyzzerella sp.]|uniref:Alpha/beta hydrolase n=1 Tax=Candidatus Fimicola merdigallinarum TaxID=2840819 RepID=A0A9D9DV50_9FIRM|nr:alpha/beta hydrolase [Candidatus Fimicola merdigallinarum]